MPPDTALPTHSWYIKGNVLNTVLKLWFWPRSPQVVDCLSWGGTGASCLLVPGGTTENGWKTCSSKFLRCPQSHLEQCYSKCAPDASRETENHVHKDIFTALWHCCDVQAQAFSVHFSSYNLDEGRWEPFTKLVLHILGHAGFSFFFFSNTNFFFKDLFLFCVWVCVCVCPLHACPMPTEDRRRFQMLWTGVIEGCELLLWVLGTKPRTLCKSSQYSWPLPLPPHALTFYTTKCQLVDPVMKKSEHRKQ